MNVIASQRTQKETDEAALVEAALGDPGAFEILYRRWVSPVYRYLFVRAGSSPEAEDLTSQVFLAVYQGLPRYRHTGNFVGWLFTIARNRANQWLKQSNREVPMQGHSPAGESLDPLKKVIVDQELHRLRQLIHTLPEKDRELIFLRYVADLSFPEMAAALNRSEAAVKKALYRLQARLYRLLEENHG